ncbi:MAG TPA: glycosyltransferase [Blastocatellia bacterium]|nr:glycosyltransferase [Blastocatellia bacterium]
MLTAEKPNQTNTSLSYQSGVAYILKGFGRTSETFITNEIFLLEKLGLRLSLFSLLRLTGQQQHAVHSEIKTVPEYLPETSSLESEGLWRWLRHNIARFSQAHARLFQKRPVTYLTTLLETLTFCFRYRHSWRPEKRFIKEFLQAGYIAARVLNESSVRHLHAHFAHTCTTVAMFASRLSGLPFSFTAHAKDIYLKSLNPGDLLRMKINRAKFVVTCTQANHQYLSAFTNKTPIHTIYHGLDTKQFAYTKRHHETDHNPLILSVGRFVEKKGFTYLVEACHLLKQRGYDFECQIVGGGDGYLKQVQALISELQLEDVIRIHPPVTQEELKTTLQRATLFALPCQVIESGDRDGIPNVLVEAMATGLPVISTNISGIPELIKDGVNGLLVPERNAEKLADAIERLMNDASLRESFSEAGRATVCSDFDAERNVQRLYRLFIESIKAEVQA